MKFTIVTAAACAALLVAGCGDSKKEDSSSGSAPPESSGQTEPSAGGAGGKTLQIAADETGELKFDKSSLEAKAGKVTIVMDNPSSVPHAVGIEGQGVDEDGETVGKGEKSTATADLKAGTYTFYCPVDGHEDAGMKGTLTVK